jgi:hypothetical protein
MNVKRIVTVALLLFVVASLAWFGAKEVLHSKAVRAARQNPVSAPTPSSAQPATQPGSVDLPPREVSKPITGSPQAGPPAAHETAARVPEDKMIAKGAVPHALGSKVIVYYLHTTARCPSCLKIEAYTATEMTGPLARSLSEGRLEWKVVNVDEPENTHFTEDYELYTKSVVVSEVRNGKEIRWKRLDKVWDYLDDQDAFMKYVDEEVRVYLKNLS